MKQFRLWDLEDEGNKRYTTSAGSPLYVPKDRKPHILELRDNSKVQRLLQEIDASHVTPEEKLFLASAAQRHAVFNYELIADYYAHASPEMQRLMEASALVIVDIDQAIERGYVTICDNIRSLYMEELSNGT